MKDLLWEDFVAKRVLPFVAKQPAGCWTWRAKRGGTKMARTFVGGRSVGVVRILWEAERGALGSAVWLRNTCGNVACINPAHHVALSGGAAAFSDERRASTPRRRWRRRRGCRCGRSIG